MANRKKCPAEILHRYRLATDIYGLLLRTDAAVTAVPGQFVSLYCKDQTKLLPRPISICEINREGRTLHLIYRVTGSGTGTESISWLRIGDHIELLGPLGNGFTQEGKRPLLIGGGIGIPPMLEQAKALANKSSACGIRRDYPTEEVSVVLGYRTNELFLKEDFEEYAKIYVATDDGTAGTKGTVIDAIRANGIEADVIYACGPKPMLRAVKAYAQENDILCYVSMEERMACGVGACLGCVCQTTGVDGHSQVHNARVCKDGPVFLAQEVEL